MNQKISGLVFALGVGLLVAWLAYTRVTDPEPARQRAQEIAVVRAATAVLAATLPAGGSLETVDPLNPNRAIGKSYVYPAGTGWEVSGYYRRGEQDAWHPWLMSLDAGHQLATLSVRDDSADIARLAASDARVSVMP